MVLIGGSDAILVLPQAVAESGPVAAPFECGGSGPAWFRAAGVAGVRQFALASVKGRAPSGCGRAAVRFLAVASVGRFSTDRAGVEFRTLRVCPLVKTPAAAV